MKKILIVAVVCSLFTSAFAKPSSLLDSFNSLNKSVNALTNAKSEAVVVSLPQGKEILPALWFFTHSEIQSNNDKVIGQVAKLTKINVLDNNYELSYKLYYKSGITLNSQESVFAISSDGQNLSIQTLSMKNYTVDKNLNHTNSGADSTVKSMNKNAQDFAETFKTILSSFSDEEYQKWSDAALYNFDVQLGVAQYAANKLKAKKWYDAHPLADKEIALQFMFTSIKESKKEGFAYELSGLCGGVDDIVFVTVYSNKDEYIDTKDNQELKVKGIIQKAEFSNSDFDKDYRIKHIYVEEN
ncbi:MAG: hypothetical protein NC041_03190 [Bacteroides sp.]|nr:hypothetical protein [Prevotella sp.]MCM1408129.1 hypothetical protein [Treponema brennaborense]MCM1469453.1 hypothetical protein [Bacteroides sp.]